MSTSLKARIADVFDEPGCDKNQVKSEKERKKGCTLQLSPGAAAGGCAFDGAKIALPPVVDVAHLVHGPIACEGNSWDNRHSASSGSQLYRTGFTMWPPARTCRNLAGLKMRENWISRVNRTWRDRHPHGLSDGVI